MDAQAQIILRKKIKKNSPEHANLVKVIKMRKRTLREHGYHMQLSQIESLEDTIQKLEEKLNEIENI